MCENWKLSRGSDGWRRWNLAGGGDWVEEVILGDGGGDCGWRR